MESENAQQSMTLQDGELAEKVVLPRIAIKFCTQCRWMLRAAYFAQELLSTFSTQIGEIALVPATGGIFTVTIWYTPSTTQEDGEGDEKARVQETLLWDRKRDGGFPETKKLKAFVRDVLDPSRDLGHVDRALKKEATANAAAGTAGGEKKQDEGSEAETAGSKEAGSEKANVVCEDCQ